MTKQSNEEILAQKKQVFGEDFRVKLVAPCTVGEGVVRLSKEQELKCEGLFGELKNQLSFFVPASGSGSRMFQFMFQWLEDGRNEELVQQLVDQWNSLALSKNVSIDFTGAKKESLEVIIQNFAQKPKGLIPFHIVEGVVRTAFQDQVLQAKALVGEGLKMHFTVQESFEEEINENILALKDLLGDIEITYSHQKEETNAYCFNENQELVTSGEHALRRPAGHGALLENLNEVDSDILLVKNIDNVQHEQKSEMCATQWKIAIGLLGEFMSSMKEIANNYTLDKVKALNDKYQFLSAHEMEAMSNEVFQELAARPTRVAGMVINEGEPGGGPFWIHHNGEVNKQIVEKAQINTELSDQNSIVQESSHFNPVFIALAKTNVYGERLNLLDFRDDSTFFVVNKTHEGEPIVYRELPGLWNGSMSNWNTIFLEIPSDVFSPVKTVLDLAKSAHQPA